ncbi:MAG: type II toxin-antitoxin system VapC family toxin [Gemmatimonadetes bacterium]|nr:type II toxin-antitoxin system VapC family toxin [Gemmatimonadota bacterium]
MIFVDTNVFMYAVGKKHPRKEQAREFFRASLRNPDRLCTSAEVLQELLHVYLATDRLPTFAEAIGFLSDRGISIWPMENEDVDLAHQLHDQFPNLKARDLCHLASCQRRGVSEVKTYDRNFGEAAESLVRLA